MNYQTFNQGVFYLGDCFDVMASAPDNCIDVILCDLPYGTTNCKWDTVVPFAQLWCEYWRVIKPSGAIVLTCAQPFTSALIMSQVKYFKYDWIWRKNLPTGFGNAKIQPMRNHESVAVFYKSQPTYNIQPTQSLITDRKLGVSNGVRSSSKSGGVYKAFADTSAEIILTEKVYPRSVLDIPCVPRATGTLHPTQKPVALFEYLIRTYSHEGELILDNCAGSGTTAIAAINTGRRFVCIEKELAYADAAVKRIREHVPA